MLPRAGVPVGLGRDNAGQGNSDVELEWHKELELLATRAAWSHGAMLPQNSPLAQHSSKCALPTLAPGHAGTSELPLPLNSPASPGPSQPCCSRPPPGKEPARGPGPTGGGDGAVVTRAGPWRRRGDFSSPFLQRLSQHRQPQAPGNVVSFCFLEVNISPGCSPGMAVAAPAHPMPCPALGKGQVAAGG